MALVLLLAMLAPADAALLPSPLQSTASIDTGYEPAVLPTLLSDADLAQLAEADAVAARSILRRSARSSPSATTRALALGLLAGKDAGTATARICARSLRTDIEGPVRRAAAECLGRLAADVAGAHTPALVAALDDGNLDVVTMAGWALANIGDPAAIKDLVKHVEHPDPRVRALFVGYIDRQRVRLGLVYQAPDVSQQDPAGNRLVPSGLVLASQASGLEVAASAGWLGLFGGAMGWYHGAFLLTAHGGPAGADSAALAGLAGTALGAAAGSAYAFSRADSLPLAHTVVQLGMAGAFAGFGAGILSGLPPASGVAAANLSFAGTLAGTAAGIALVETRPPTIGGLGVGMAIGLTMGTASGALFRGYGLRDDAALGAALLVGSTASVVGTLACAELQVGLFPLVGGTTGAMAGAGAGAWLALAFEPVAFTEGTGWTIAAATLAGAGGGALAGALLPRELDPLLAHELQLLPLGITVLPTSRGEGVPAMVLGGRF